jgi:hypothetical protein
MLVSVGTAYPAGYSGSEILFIEWGDGPNQLKIEEPRMEESEGGNLYPVPGGGPDQVFVDMNDIFYFGSFTPGYFKAFNLEGNLRIDWEPGTPSYNDSLFGNSIQCFYVDTLSRIYFDSFGPRDFIAVADMQGKLLDRLNPLGLGSGITISLIGANSNDVLSFACWNDKYYTYSGGGFTEGGSSAWKARDGYYYDAIRRDSVTIRFYKFPKATPGGGYEDLDTVLAPFMGGSDGVEFLGLDDSLRIYLLTVTNIAGEYFNNYGIQIFTNDFKLEDTFNFDPTEENHYMWYEPIPFVRRDGNIYEFRCLDDGLHVVRWSKE